VNPTKDTTRRKGGQCDNNHEGCVSACAELSNARPRLSASTQFLGLTRDALPKAAKSTVSVGSSRIQCPTCRGYQMTVGRDVRLPRIRNSGSDIRWQPPNAACEGETWGGYVNLMRLSPRLHEKKNAHGRHLRPENLSIFVRMKVSACSATPSLAAMWESEKVTSEISTQVCRHQFD